jgi:hypothetical protein
MGTTSSKDSDAEKRDGWSKAQIILSPVGGLLTALSVAILGFYGSAYLSRKQESDTRARVYAELTSQREQAESILRKDMFGSIFESFLKAPTPSIDIKVLNMELLAYNFHESLNLKPLFSYLQRQIGTPKDDQTKGYLARLEKVARDVTHKQMLVLEEDGQKFDSTIDLKMLRERPQDVTPDSRSLRLEGIERTFRLLPLAVDPEARELQFRLEIITPKPSPETNRVEFWAGFYDFPMIDNTRLSHDQRCAVVLRTFEADHAEVTLVYFPGSRAGLKEKPFYEDVIRNLQKRVEPAKE